MNNDRGMRSTLQVGLCVAAACLLHAALFLIPGVRFAPKEAGTERGVRLRVFRPAPPAPAPARESAPVLPLPAKQPIRQASVPTEVSPERYSRIGGNTGGDEPLAARQPSSGGSGDAAAPGDGRGSVGGTPVLSEYGQYLAHLRSDSVQGWAKEIARKESRGWKGKGAGTGRGNGAGAGTGTGAGAGGPGGGGENYLDPRIQMVVTSYPRTGIESRFTRVSYPNLKFKKSQYTSGWWNVYIQVWTDAEGGIRKLSVLRPETDGPLERQFVEQVRREIATWRFDPVEAEILVDVRFYVE